MKMNKKGFTIVELVIVIAVIAILAGVLIPTFSGLVQKAQDSAAIQEARNKYTEYVGLHDYSKGTSPAQNIVIEVGTEFVIVKEGKLQDKVYTDKSTAVTDAGANAAFICDEHDWTDANGECKECDAKCPVEHAASGGNAKCTTCNMENAIVSQ